ncbi:T9SS type A sorting domain-containing protein [Hymenobacter sp. 5317J-9]|uniref:T9SS type A sorting domain-containing protein n=1 Tax=Hymenobacter sp. 5317J-9 TaxID=2932250 RepID=UPI001FD6B4A2|nr:T9SS type A sorting domain-containing protein [Hymenobacter sp. 5317J-9]UOQ97734.1 T9SS type A sorting domain-containing protein [Hymenobacter sp. 5317J-9]
MSRLARFCQCLTVVGGWCFVLAYAALAQPALVSERKNRPRFQQLEGIKSFELPGHRFLHCSNTWVNGLVNGQGRSKIELTLTVSKANGDTVRYQRLNRNQLNGGDYMTDAVLGPDQNLTVLCNHLTPNANPTLPGSWTYSLIQLDTLGQVRWQQFYPVTPVSTVAAASALLQVPDGFLVLVSPVSPASTSTATYTQGGVAKFDRQGTPLWQRTWPSRGYGGVGSLGGLVARPDGSYLATGFADNGTIYNGGATSPRLDYWLVQFSPQGDTIRTARFGVSPQFETGYAVFNTANGGAVVSGVRRLPTSANNDAVLLQVDSLLRPQWSYIQPNPSGYSEYFNIVQPMRSGNIVVGGGRYVYLTGENYGYLAAFSAGGVPRWSWQHHYANNPQNLTGYSTMISRPDSSAYLAGGFLANSSATTGEDLFTHVANVGAPYVADLCRVRPQALVGYAFTAGGDSLRLVSLSTAGPRYAALALWRWDFGDGTFFDGPAPPPHRYAPGTGAGTAVRLTVTNNLGCTSTQAVFPFALAAAGARALVAGARLWPNPTAGAATLEVPGLRAQPPVPVEVLNALGQVVRARVVPVRGGVARAELNLTGLPPGVYAVRLRAAEGAVVKRFVRE